MKKFLCGALIALTAIFMASCKSGGSSSDYSKGGERPKIDTEAGTVNGKAYDNKEECCWEITMKGSSAQQSGSGTSYMWGTEFFIVSTLEEEMWYIAQSDVKVSASYSYSKNSAKDYESCLDQNEDLFVGEE